MTKSTAAQRHRVVKLIQAECDASARIGKEPDAEIVRGLIARCVEIDKRERRLGPASVRSAMPDHWRTYDEREIDARQRLVDIEAGDDAHVVIGLDHFRPGASELDDAEAIEAVFKDAMGGEHVDRDWRFLFQLESGKGHRQLGRCNCHGAPANDSCCARTCRINHERTVTRQRILDIQAARVPAIWKALRPTSTAIREAA
jgi:hypothetical protein